MQPVSGETRQRLLDPVDRVSEILFGLIMAVTIVGSVSIATEGKAEVRTVLLAALGCNLAWGLVDAVMYVIRTVTERSRLKDLGARIRGAAAAAGRDLIAGAVPDHIAPMVGAEELEGMRRRLLALPPDDRALLRSRDLVEAAAVFAMVVLATFPVVLPFIFVHETAPAFRLSQGITLVMLFFAGAALGRHAAHPKPIKTGIAMALFGALLIAVVKALGG